MSFWLKKIPLFLIVPVVAIIAAVAVSVSYFSAINEIDRYTQSSLKIRARATAFSPVAKRVPKQIVKGLYLTAYSAGNPAKIDEIIKLIEATELNSVVIDIKDYSGLVLYDSQIPLVKQLKTKSTRIKNLPALIRKLHDRKIYVIARQTVFQDPTLAEKKPEWSIRNKIGEVWRDNKGLSWVDPTRKEVWKYNMALAQEAVSFGFDEINFDYVRFPSDGNMADVAYAAGAKKKYEVMAEFYKFVSTTLARTPAWISFDMFGLVMEAGKENDLKIGQRLVDAVNAVDYVCPMMYPSHYPSGHLGLVNPAANAYAVVDNGMRRGEKWFKNTRAQVRPWLQAFDLGAEYSDGVRIREQIDAVEKYPNAGWMLWNASNRYTSAGLNPKSKFPISNQI